MSSLDYSYCVIPGPTRRVGTRNPSITRSMLSAPLVVMDSGFRLAPAPE